MMSSPHKPELLTRNHPTIAYTWIGGIVLVLVGALLLLHNSGMLALPANWWTVFILIPAAVVIGVAWTFYRQAGNRFTPDVGWSLTAAAVLVTVAAVFLFALSWGQIWPVFLILAGIGMLLGWLSSPRTSPRR